MNSLRKYKFLGGLLITLHIVGAIGCMIDYARPMMLMLTPLNLIVSSSILFFVDQNPKNKVLAFLLLSATIGFFIELIGIKTGLVFGNYSYGNTLGLKLWDVPLIIGINWFMLSYIFGNIVSNFRIASFLKIIFAASLMTAFDVLIEPTAIKLDYWGWDNSVIPLKNYIGWFITSVIIQMLYQKFNFKKQNPTAYSLLISQLIFFITLFIYFQKTIMY